MNDLCGCSHPLLSEPGSRCLREVHVCLHNLIAQSVTLIVDLSMTRCNHAMMSVIAIEVCMFVVIGVPGVPATPDLKVGSIAPAEMCDAIRMTSLATRAHYYPSLARGVFVKYAYTTSSHRV